MHCVRRLKIIDPFDLSRESNDPDAEVYLRVSSIHVLKKKALCVLKLFRFSDAFNYSTPTHSAWNNNIVSDYTLQLKDDQHHNYGTVQVHTNVKYERFPQQRPTIEETILGDENYHNMFNHLLTKIMSHSVAYVQTL